MRNNKLDYIIIYRADVQDDAPSPLLTSGDHAQAVTVYSPPSLLRTFLRRQKIFFTLRSKRRSRVYFTLARLLRLRYWRTAEVRTLLRTAPSRGAVLFVANDYRCANIYGTYLHGGLGCPTFVRTLSRGRHFLPYITWIWLLTRLHLLRRQAHPEMRVTPTASSRRCLWERSC